MDDKVTDKVRSNVIINLCLYIYFFTDHVCIM